MTGPAAGHAAGARVTGAAGCLWPAAVRTSGHPFLDDVEVDHSGGAAKMSASLAEAPCGSALLSPTARVARRALRAAARVDSRS